MKLLVERVEPNRLRMADRAAQDFSAVTDLADLLVRNANLSFRDAHHIIGAVVRQALDQGVPATGITAQMIDAAALEQVGRRASLSEDDIGECLDPIRNVAARRSFGAPAPDGVLQRIGEQRLSLKKRADAIDAVGHRLAEAQTLLEQRTRALVSSESNQRA